MSSSAQRKRSVTESPRVLRTRKRSNRAANVRTKTERAVNISDPAPPTDLIDVINNTEDGVEEVVDLTCDGSEAAGSEAAVVDLTAHNDSVLLVDEGPQKRRIPEGESYVLSSDDEDTPSVLLAATKSMANTSRSAPGLISCPICLDHYSEIVNSGRLVVSTKCGHVFCSQCLRDSLRTSHTCPTCRNKLTARQYHPLYV
uniref:Ring finger protein 4 n=1 Tax=Nothobranchius korthausae TaxID=1143690 RepID=A0A1A8EWK4_9TELE